MKSNGLDEPVWRACSTFVDSAKKTYYETSYKLGKQWKVEEF
jgi:hypothetical protein